MEEWKQEVPQSADSQHSRLTHKELLSENNIAIHNQPWDSSKEIYLKITIILYSVSLERRTSYRIHNNSS